MKQKIDIEVRTYRPAHCQEILVLIQYTQKPSFPLTLCIEGP